MFATKRRVVAVVGAMAVLVSMGLDARSAGAAIPPGHPFAMFAYNIDATTHIKKLDQTLTIVGGRFEGILDLATGDLEGSITLPETTFTYYAEGIVPVITATARIVPTGPVTGHVYFGNPTAITSTASFNIRIISAYAAALPTDVEGTSTNLVGHRCSTITPVTVTMSGVLADPVTFGGEFTLPNFKHCGYVQTNTLNQLLPGPGNTFSATAY